MNEDRYKNVRHLLCKVPEVTLYFWLIKIMSTTVGETGADFLSFQLHWGMGNTTYLMFGMLLILLFFQFKANRYIPALYWGAVLLISVVGTLISDQLVDHIGVSLVTATVLFSAILVLVFLGWYASERTLSIHSVYTKKREAFYWLAILFTFALGTAGGDLVSEGLGLGYLKSGIVFATLIVLMAVLHFSLHLDSVFTFWATYILTRPLGASLGDYLSHARKAGGLGLGTTGTSLIFTAAILALVFYLTWTRRDQFPAKEEEA